MVIHSILVGVDDSDGARAALSWADRFAQQQRAAGNDITAAMMFAWSRPTIDTEAIFDDGVFEARAGEALAELGSDLSGSTTFEPVTRFGYPTYAILKEAESRNVDLIVVGSRGRSAIAQVILGSVSRGVAAKSDRPVVVIPKSPQDGLAAESGSAPTVVGYDDSPGSQAAMRWALDNLTGPIVALSAWVMPTPVIHDPSDPEVQQFHDSTEQALHRGLKDLCGGTIDPRITPVVQHDDPRIAILGHHEAAQIVIGARAERGFKGVLLGSTVTYVATHATVPVFIIPPVE